jgi:predicted TIM-barrel fold metal-dependent hydrolase
MRPLLTPLLWFIALQQWWPSESAAQTARLVPFGNYHAHLVSDSSARLLVVPPLVEVTLAPEIDGVIREWERATKVADDSSLAALFTADGLLGQPTGWVRGRAAIRAAAGNQGPADLRVRAHAFSIADSVATVTGSLADQTSTAIRDVAKVTFTLRRDRGGRWLVESFLRANRPTPTSTSGAPYTAAQLIEHLDSAGITRAVVLSVAYWFGSKLMPGAEKGVPDAVEQARVTAENDWVAGEVAKYPSRLIGFCSVHPLKDYAIDEIGRCGKHPGLRGLKLHLANSGVDLRKPEDVEQLGRVFRAANQHRLAIVVHMRPRLQPYGREDVDIMLREVLPQAPDIPIQIAHLAGWGSYDDAADQAADAFAEAIARKDPATRNLYFDITTIVFQGQAPELQERIAERIRQIGLRRIVYGSDLNEPRRDWGEVLRLIPLTRDEFGIIASNAAPYLTGSRK